jgi:1,4-alpha-glucan branching enzyme
MEVTMPALVTEAPPETAPQTESALPTFIAPSDKLGMGATLVDGGCLYRVWAPNANAVAVGGDFFHSGNQSPIDWQEIPLQRDSATGEGASYWSAFVPGALHDSHYKFHIRNDSAPPDWAGPWRWKHDPYARDAISFSGNSIVVDRNFDWSGDNFQMPPWNELVIYELHIGTFGRKRPDEKSDFTSAIGRLDYLRDLGINAIEVLPAFDFDTDTSMGYNPGLPFAVDNAYGELNAIKSFIKEAHRRGIAVMLDVVYNHFGPEGLDDCLGKFDGLYPPGTQGIYFYEDGRLYTPWGDNRPDFGRGEVRLYIRDHAMTCLDEIRADGLRLDSTVSIRRLVRRYDDLGPNPEGVTLLRYLGEEKRKSSPWKLLIAEDLQNDDTLTRDALSGGVGLDAQWDNWFSGRVRNAMFAFEDNERNPQQVAEAISKSYNSSGAFQRVNYTESHDDANKARIPSLIDGNNPQSIFALRRTAIGAALMFTAPGIPMLFMGQEFLESKPWNDGTAFALDWSRIDRFSGMVELHRRLIRVRRNQDNNTRGLCGDNVNVFHVNPEGVVAFHRWAQGGPGDDVVVVANLSNRRWDSYNVGFPREGTWYLRFNSDWQGYAAEFTNVGYDTTAASGWNQGMPANGNVGLGPYSVIVLSQ